MNPTKQSGDRDATAFWKDRGGLDKDISAVSPGQSNTRYANWTRRCLQDWTLGRVRRYVGPRCRRVVDLGCGYGDWTVLFGAIADEIIACDVTEGFVNEARRRLQAAGHPSATVSLSDVRSFGAFADADLVYLGAVMTYLEDRDCVDLLRAAGQRLTPGGILLSRDWCAINLGRTTVNQSNWFSIHRRARRYVELAAEAGFEVIETQGSPMIYGEQMARAAFGRADDRATPRIARWPLQAVWRLATLSWTRASVSFVMRRR